MLSAGQVNEHKVGNDEWVKYTKKNKLFLINYQEIQSNCNMETGLKREHKLREQTDGSKQLNTSVHTQV